MLRDFGSAADGRIDLLMMASGSEVHLILDAAERLHAGGVSVRVVSFPSWDLFELEDEDYRRSVLPDGVTARLVVEAAQPLGWSRYVGATGRTIAMDRFGASAPADVLAEQFGFTVDNVVKVAKEILGA